MTLPFLEKYINRQAVLKILIQYRCKEAERIQRVIVVDHLAVSNGRTERARSCMQEVYSLFPPRRQWVHVGCDRRKKLTQIQKSELSLLLTVLRERNREAEHPEWYQRLESRIDKIIKAAITNSQLFASPRVSVIEKKRDEKKKSIECRPICLFKTLDERVYASLFNKVYTNLFDTVFYDNSFAFRAHQYGDPQMLHLKAVRAIKQFRKTHSGNLWVAECDMKKFYDTIDHDLIKMRFSQIISWKKQAGDINIEEARILKRVIYSYVNCYSFYKDVYKYNNKPLDPIWRHIAKSEKYDKCIKWVLNEIESRCLKEGCPYRTKRHYKHQLGVPQGGALSGIIANVVMHFVDLRLREYWMDNPAFLYVRFCDDMIMIGEKRAQIENAFECYSNSIKMSNLYMHEPRTFDDKRMKFFWEGKTRPPYQWGAPSKNVFPWITFVGYDVNWEGDTRIRRSTIKKEILKQYEKRVEIEHLLRETSGRNPQWSKQYVWNSVYKRMIGMSVGRVPLWDYKTFDNNYSWAKAFVELTDNPWSEEQLRRLDMHRNLMMKRLSRFLLGLNYGDIKPSDKKEQSRAIWFFGKPYSYFGQVLKKW